MIPFWNELLEKSVERLYRRMISANSVTSTVFRDAALGASGLPVYCDISGCLVITPKGNIVCYNCETRQVGDIVEPGWMLIALVKASETYDELRELRPVKPHDAQACKSCNGTGKILSGKIWCKECWGTGWRKGEEKAVETRS
ncbi:MAG TPA: hypothetical protein VH643_16455 [Gemmataceae bacterium]|jgi:hypothetical protein